MSQVNLDVVFARRVEALCLALIVCFAVDQLARHKLCRVIGAGQRSAIAIEQQKLLVIRLSNRRTDA
jgi:hypothetical protein